MSETLKDNVRTTVRGAYAGIAKPSAPPSCQSLCCPDGDVEETARSLGYSESDLKSAPEGANLGLGCGNPAALASLETGETVLDLGSGAGFDCFLAARQVGELGCVIGVDMTPEMVSKARKNAEKSGYKQVEFRLGEIEHLPIPDSTVDVVISNCVINLSPDKAQVFREAYRVLKPGGRLAVSDVVTASGVPEHLRNNTRLFTSCMAGASPVDELESYLRTVGFEAISVRPQKNSGEIVRRWAPDMQIENYVFSAYIEARKPRVQASKNEA